MFSKWYYSLQDAASSSQHRAEAAPVEEEEADVDYPEYAGLLSDHDYDDDFHDSVLGQGWTRPASSTRNEILTRLPRLSQRNGAVVETSAPLVDNPNRTEASPVPTPTGHKKKQTTTRSKTQQAPKEVIVVSDSDS